VLNLSVPVAADEANHEVNVTVEAPRPAMTQEEWHRFIAGMAGAWLGDLDRPERSDFEQRDAL
jgi:hypothetical protein